MANTEFVGKKLNVESRKGTHVETIVKQLNTKGIVRTEEGNEYQIADLRKKGRGVFVSVGGGAKPKTTQAAPAQAAPAQRTASAVTFDEIEGKKVDGKAVVKVLRTKGTVKLEDGSIVELASISRKGRGYVSGAETSAPAPKATGGARPKTTSTETAGESVTNNDIRGQNIKLRVDGVLQTVTRTIKGEKFETDKGFKGNTADIQKVGSKYVLETAEYKKAQAKANAPAPEAKPSRAPAPIKRSELKGKNITVGDEVHVVEKTFKTDEVETNKGFKFPVSDVARKGRGYIYTGELAAKKGGAVPKQRPAPEPVSTIVEVEAFDYDTMKDISDLLEKAVRAALADAYDIDVASTFVQHEDQIATISFQITTADAPAALVKQRVESFRSQTAAQAIESPAPRGNTKAKLNGDDDADFSSAELSDEDDEDDEEVAQAAPANSDDDDDDDDSDDSEFSNEDDDVPASDDDDDDADDSSFEEEEVKAASFPEDATKYIEGSLARLSKLFPGKSMNGFVTRWFESQEAFDAVGDEIEPGLTIEVEGKEYALVGLKNDGAVMLVNVQTSGAYPNLDLDGLQILVAENDRNA